MKKLLACAVLSLASVSSHAATIVFQDNFEAYNVGGSVTNFGGNWTVSNGTVDLVGPGFFGGLALGGGKSVDLDGSTNNAGTFTSRALSLTSGDYVLTFDLAGNQRGGDDTVNLSVSLGLAMQTFTLASNVPYTTQTVLFSVSGNSSSNIIFDHLGGNNIGLLLDNVALTRVSEVPVPAAAWLFGSAVLGFFGARRRSV